MGTSYFCQADKDDTLREVQGRVELQLLTFATDMGIQRHLIAGGAHLLREHLQRQPMQE